MAISNHIVGLLNFLSMLVSIPIIGAGVWLAVKHTTERLHYLQWPILAIGLLIFFISLAGLIGSCCRVTWLLFLYLAAMLLIIIALFAVTVFVFVVTSQGSGESVSGRDYQEYHLNNYAKWFQNEVTKVGQWETITASIQDAKVCQKLNCTDSQSFYNANLSPLQSGCCKPPTACNFSYVNAVPQLQHLMETHTAMRPTSKPGVTISLNSATTATLARQGRSRTFELTGAKWP